MLKSLTRCSQMLDRSEIRVYASLLQQCGKKKDLQKGKRVYELMIRSGYVGDRYLQNLVVEMYGRCGNLEGARSVFDGITSRNVYSWTIMIAVYAQNGHLAQASELLKRMYMEGVKPTSVTFVAALGACEDVAEGKVLHDRVLSENLMELDTVMGTAVLSMYGNCGCVDDARRVFDSMQEKDVVAWSAMISVYSQSGHFDIALELYERMYCVEKMVGKETVFVSVLDACANLRDLRFGKMIHGHIVKAGLDSDDLRPALVNMYGKCGSVDDAKSVFEKTRHREIHLWSAMAAAYAQEGYYLELCLLLKKMDIEGLKPNESIFACSIGICSQADRLAEGRKLHARAVALGLERDGVVSTALVNMYGKCGLVEEARNIFENIRYKHVASWNVMLAAYSQQGYALQALELYYDMEQQGIFPDNFTLVSVLFSCSHKGLIEEAKHSFHSMLDRGISASVQHYRCIVDLLGRAGKLDQAEELINHMPFEPDAVSWLTLLASCKIHACSSNNINATMRAERAVERVVDLDPDNLAPYVMLVSIYAGANRWDDVRKLTKLISCLSGQSEIL